MPKARGAVHIGCSGWSYPGWRGIVYDKGQPQNQWFGHYATLLSTVEVNNTFYRLPPEATFASWEAQAPPGFIYAVKLNRYGSHVRRLREPGSWLPNYLARVALLGRHLGPQLVQLPPRWHCDIGRLNDFFSCAWEAEGSLPSGRLRWALEVRDRSWLNDNVFCVLQRHQVALCVHDMIDSHPWQLTTGWSYVRFHGPGGPGAKYSGEYTGRGLRGAARRLERWQDEGADVYVYFNNDTGGASLRDATWLCRRLMG